MASRRGGAGNVLLNVTYSARQLAHSRHRMFQVHRGEAGKPVRVQQDPVRDPDLVDQIQTVRTAPRAEQRDGGGVQRRSEAHIWLRRNRTVG